MVWMCEECDYYFAAWGQGSNSRTPGENTLKRNSFYFLCEVLVNKYAGICWKLSKIFGPSTYSQVISLLWIIIQIELLVSKPLDFFDKKLTSNSTRDMRYISCLIPFLFKSANIMSNGIRRTKKKREKKPYQILPDTNYSNQKYCTRQRRNVRLDTHNSGFG